MVKKAPRIPLDKYLPFMLEFPKLNPTYHKKYPDIYRIPMIGYTHFFLSKPEYIKYVLQDHSTNYIKGYHSFKIVLGNGLIVNEGEEWVNKRRAIQPVFRKKNLDRIAVIIARRAAEMVRKWDGQKEVDVTEELEQLIISLVAESLFGVHYDDATIKTIRHDMALISKVGYFFLLGPVRIPNWVPKVPLPNRYMRALRRLEKIVDETIKQHKAQTQSSNNLLSTLLEHFSDDPMAGQKIKDETMTFLITGHETVAPVLCWCFYLLGKNPKVRKKLRQEILNAGPTDIHPPENIHAYPYLINVINETLRLYPPAYVFYRRSLSKDQIGPFVIPAKSNIIINIYGLHRNEKYWEQADDFRPERFENFKHSRMNKFIFMPYGAGTRTCIADHLSLYEMTIIIIKVLEKFDFEYIGVQDMPMDAKVTLRPKKHVRIKLTSLKK